MATSEAVADRIVVSIVCLRRGRKWLALSPQPRDRFAIKARIDIYEELMNNVEEIDRSLKRLSLDSYPERAEELCLHNRNLRSS